MKPRVMIFLSVLTILVSNSLWAQVITKDQFRRNEWQMKVQRYEKEKARLKEDQRAILDQADYDTKYWELLYDMTNISGQILTGKAVETNQSNIDNLSSIDYNFTTGMTADSVFVGTTRVTATRPANILHIPLDRAYNTGELFTTTVYYHGHPDPSGFGSFTFDSHSGTPIVSTLSEPEGSRDWWPCKDAPHDKADSADVYITCNSSYTGVSNGLLVSNQDNGNGTRTFHWHTSYAIPTYLICMAVTNYQSFTQWYVGLNGDSMQITNYAYPELYNAMVEDLNIAPNALHVYASIFGEYPFFHEKFGYSMFPWSGGMEHQENIYMGYMLFSGNHWYDWITVHEMSHHWFGDAITCDTWPDVWMNEGFASYCEALYYERMQGFDAYVSYEVNNNSVSDPSGPIYNPSELFDGNTVYNKGSWVLHMLRGVMGDSAFFHGMYFYENNSGHQYGTIITREFQHIMEPFYGDSLGWFFDEWVWGQNRPIYRYSWIKQDVGNGRYEVFLHVRQTQTSPAPDVFTMPIKIYPHINNVDTMITVWDDSRTDDFRFIVNGNPTSLLFDKVPWILCNSASETYTMNIVTTVLPNGTVGVAYSDTIEARGGVTPYHFTLQSGQLPAGLTLTNTGILSGTPTAAQVDSFTIRCTDSSSPAKIDDQAYIVTIAPPLGCQYIPGDINGNGAANGIDIVYAVNYLKGGPHPPINCSGICPESSPFFAAGDVNGNCAFNSIDITYFVRYLKNEVPSLLNCPDCPPLP